MSSLVAFSWDILYSKLNNTTPYSLGKYLAYFEDTKSNYPAKCPLFVTWDILENGESELRGCIGTFSKMDLVAGLRDYSLISALKDTRFPPIAKSELEDLQCSVTLLTNFEPIVDRYDWEVGKHGLKINIYEDQSHYSSTFLPSVAEDQNWDQETTLMHLIRKSGYRLAGQSMDSLNWDIERYQGDKYELTYDEFISVREALTDL